MGRGQKQCLSKWMVRSCANSLARLDCTLSASIILCLNLIHILFGMHPSVKSIVIARFRDGASILMHDVGHNLGLGHSNEGAEEYGDESCIMGSGFSEEDGALIVGSWGGTLHEITFTMLQTAFGTVGSSVQSIMVMGMTLLPR